MFFDWQFQNVFIQENQAVFQKSEIKGKIKHLNGTATLKAVESEMQALI